MMGCSLNVNGSKYPASYVLENYCAVGLFKGVGAGITPWELSRPHYGCV